MYYSDISRDEFESDSNPFLKSIPTAFEYRVYKIHQNVNITIAKNSVDSGTAVFAQVFTPSKNIALPISPFPSRNELAILPSLTNLKEYQNNVPDNIVGLFNRDLFDEYVESLVVVYQHSDALSLQLMGVQDAYLLNQQRKFGNGDYNLLEQALHQSAKDSTQYNKEFYDEQDPDKIALDIEPHKIRIEAWQQVYDESIKSSDFYQEASLEAFPPLDPSIFQKMSTVYDRLAQSARYVLETDRTSKNK